MADGYEKIVQMIKGKSLGNDCIFVTTMDSADSCTVNGLHLDSDDLYIAEHLATRYVKSYSGDTATYSKALSAGDTVIVAKLSDKKYVVLERVV